jgi:hypothetical protein
MIDLSAAVKYMLLCVLSVSVSASLSFAQEAESEKSLANATEGQITGFPSYSVNMTPQACQSLFDEIMDALSNGATVSQEAIGWAIEYESTAGTGQSCPPVSAPANVAAAPAEPTPPYSTSLVPASVQTDCIQNNSLNACIEVYRSIRGEEPEGYVVAEHICETWGRGEYCFEAGADLLLGNGNTWSDQDRAYDNFYSGCYKRNAVSCYQGGNLKLARARGREDYYDAMLLFDIACTNFGYRDSCALKRAAQGGGDAAVAAANQRLRSNHDDALRCEKTRIIGNGGRSHISYDCRTNLEWRLGKKR